MTKSVKPVDMMYLGQHLGDGQNPDAPWDHSAGTGPNDEKIGGKGSQSGGSKPTPQAAHRRSTATSGSSKPRIAQRLRG